MTIGEIYELCSIVENILERENIYAEVYPHDNYLKRPMIQVEIRWGDWKHDHLRADWLIENNIKGLINWGEQITEEDGSDTYSAIHNYLIIDNLTLDNIKEI